MQHDGRSERKGLLAGDHSINGRYGSVSNESPRLCLVFNDSFLGGKRAAWLTKLKASGFEVEQVSVFQRMAGSICRWIVFSA